jgi:hypothetical protein
MHGLERSERRCAINSKFSIFGVLIIRPFCEHLSRDFNVSAGAEGCGAAKPVSAFAYYSPRTGSLCASGVWPFWNASSLSSLLYLWPGTNPRLPRDVVGGGKENDGESTLIGRGYLVRQAATLLKFAQTTTDPKVAAGLVEKAADLRSQVDEASALPDLSSRAPDVEPPAAT